MGGGASRAKVLHGPVLAQAEIAEALDSKGFDFDPLNSNVCASFFVLMAGPLLVSLQ